MEISNQVAEITDALNLMLDEHQYDQALTVSKNMLDVLRNTENLQPEVEGFAHYCYGLVVLSGWEFHLQCSADQLIESAEEQLVQWAALLPAGRQAASRARDLLPEHDPSQEMASRYDQLASRQEVYLTGKMMTRAQAQQVNALVNLADRLKGQRDYLAALQEYDKALSFLYVIGYTDTNLEGQLHLQIGTCVLNGHHCAASWAAGDEGPELQLKESEGQLMDRFVKLMPRGLSEAYEAVKLLPNHPSARKLVDLFEGVRSRAPFWFETR